MNRRQKKKKLKKLIIDLPLLSSVKKDDTLIYFDLLDQKTHFIKRSGKE